MPDVSYSAEMPANGRRTSKEPNQHPEPDDRDRLLPREELGMNQPAVNERVGAVGERDRRQPAEHPFERALEEKRASHEAVGRAHQAHDGDLAEPVDVRHPVAPEPDVVHEAEAAQPLGDLVHVLHVTEAGLELHLDRSREGVAFELLQHVAELHELRAGTVERLIFAHVRGRLHFGKCLDVLLRQRDGFDRRAREQVSDDLHPLGDVAQRLLQVHGDEPEQSDDEQREGDRSDGEGGEERGAPEREQRLADHEVHGLAAWSRGSSTAESYTRAPSCSSITRYGACRTRSRSWVAITTAVPLALMSRSSWNTPRVARSSRLPVGSSASSTVGSFTRARAIATRCCSPPESSRGYACALAARPTCVSTRITRAGIVEERAPVTSSANATFSSAVRSSSSRKSWKTMPSLRRSRGTSRGRISFTLYPETRTSPEVGRSSA